MVDFSKQLAARRACHRIARLVKMEVGYQLWLDRFMQSPDEPVYRQVFIETAVFDYVDELQKL